MNFYKFYNLLNENTVSQELKRIKKEDDNLDFSVEGLYEYIKISLTKLESYINEKSIERISKWFTLIIINWYKKEYKRILEINKNSPLRKILRNKSLKDLLSLDNKITNLTNMSVDYLSYHTDEYKNLYPDLLGKFNNINFDYKDFEKIVKDWHDDLKKGNIKLPGPKGKTILEFPDGHKWVNLERPSCALEAKAGRHCGNSGARTGDTILSLRDEKNFVCLTFILNNGMLEERKGFANSKPSEKYHPYILELLKMPIIKGLGAGRYLPKNDFQLSDLNKEQIEELKKVNPNFTIK